MAANRGEWAELYVMFKLLGEGKIYAADEKLEKNPDSYLDIIRIIREEVKNKLIEYKTGAIVEITMDKEPVISIPAVEFLRNADILLKTITSSEGRSFDVLSETKNFKETALVKRNKAPSFGYYGGFGGKNDIIMEIYDHRTALFSVAGFSIKSKYNNPPTLFNAAKASAFTYELLNISDEQLKEINSFVTSTGGRDKNSRIDYILLNNIGVSFSRVRDVFGDNLENIRGDMIQILDCILRTHYFCRRSNSKLTDITSRLTTENPLGKRNPDIFYMKAVKDLLYASFAGMTASERWDGKMVVNGGYIVAKEDGDVLAYHAKDLESFRTFLFNNTHIDRPSSSESKYDYAFVYKESGKYYLDLNFQIRFND